MSMKAGVLGTMILSMLWLAACQESTLKTGFRGGDGGPQALRFCDVALSYESVKPIFENRCQRCHQSGSRNAVTSYNEVFRIKDSIHFEVSNDLMPDDGPLVADQKRLMVAWLEAGAPETSAQVLACPPTGGGEKPGDNPPAEEPPVVVTPPRTEPGEQPTEPGSPGDPPAEPPVAPTPTPPGQGPARTYAELREKVLVPKCMNCHSLDGSAMLYDFTDYRSMVALTDIFDRANPANSVIVQVVLKEGRGQMPPVRSNIPRLTDDEVELLRGWIEDGLLE